MTTPQLQIPHLASNQDQAEITINGAFDALDNAGNRVFLLSGGVDDAAAGTTTWTLTAAQLRGNALFRMPEPTATHTGIVVVPTGVSRMLLIRNGSTTVDGTIQLAGGVSPRPIGANSTALCFTDGVDLVIVAGGAAGTNLVQALEELGLAARLRDTRTRPTDDEGQAIFLVTTGIPTGHPLPVYTSQPDQATRDAMTPIEVVVSTNRYTGLRFVGRSGTNNTLIPVTTFDVEYYLTGRPAVASGFLADNSQLWVERVDDRRFKVWAQADSASTLAALERVEGFFQASLLERAVRNDRTRSSGGAMSNPDRLGKITNAFLNTSSVTIRDGSPALTAQDVYVTSLGRDAELGEGIQYTNLQAAARLRVVSHQAYLAAADHAALLAIPDDEAVDLAPGESTVCSLARRAADPADADPFDSTGARDTRFVGRAVGAEIQYAWPQIFIGQTRLSGRVDRINLNVVAGGGAAAVETLLEWTPSAPPEITDGYELLAAQAFSRALAPADDDRQLAFTFAISTTSASDTEPKTQELMIRAGDFRAASALVTAGTTTTTAFPFAFYILRSDGDASGRRTLYIGRSSSNRVVLDTTSGNTRLDYIRVRLL